MCAKGERRCEEREELQLQAGAEWAVAEELEQVRAAWARLGGAPDRGSGPFVVYLQSGTNPRESTRRESR